MVVELPPGQQRLQIEFAPMELESAEERQEPSSLDGLRSRVLSIMATIPELADENLGELEDVPLGRLRRDATRLHGVCRYRKGKRSKASEIGPRDVREVALHPQVLEEEWDEYASFLLFHEFLHALGHVHHDKTFRKLEATWPNTEVHSLQNTFARHIRSINSRWSWTCPECGWCCSRSLRAAGRYRCRSCRVPLVDVPTITA